MGNFTFKHIDQQDDLYKTKTAAEIKAALDSQPNELKAVLNALIDSLQATTAGDSGAKNLGVSTISGVTGANIQAVLEDLKLQINGAVAGSIPDGSITQAKLAFSIATNAASTTIADTSNKFTANNVEDALLELFTSANSVKTNVSGAIGSPATVNDTGVQLASRITTEKGRIASEVGDGTSADTLQYLTDRLVVRSDEIATAVNAKGVTATSADTLAQLATKIGQIPTGKKQADGTTSFNGSSSLVVTGLDFLPKIIGITSGLITSSGNSKNYIIKFFDDGKGGYTNRLLGYNMTDGTGPLNDLCTVSKTQGGFTVTMATNLFPNKPVNWFTSE